MDRLSGRAGFVGAVFAAPVPQSLFRATRVQIDVPQVESV
ncbi:hypothetical protein EV641_11678 [Rhodococcus sp. SMB37]|nr:hypothetical protein EV641_11678 [Rhodococcus sp. SMB37]